MSAIMNDPRFFVDDFLDGVFAVHPELKRGSGRHTVLRSEIDEDEQVAVVTGGGSGHLPLFLGYVGRGAVDGAAVGQVFSSPSAESILSVIRDVNRGRGVLLLYGNYGGDRMNFDLAAELADAEGIQTQTVVAVDDVASAPLAEKPRRRGVAGLTLLYRIAGAAAASGADLSLVAALTQRAASNLGHSWGGSCLMYFARS